MSQPPDDVAGVVHPETDPVEPGDEHEGGGAAEQGGAPPRPAAGGAPAEDDRAGGDSIELSA